MRLLHSSLQGTFCLTDDLNNDPHVIPRYAILSHTWGADNDEVTFDDIQNGAAKNKTGYAKLDFCAEQARKDGIDYFWIDTCCINKANLSELSEAITSMFRWYRNAVKCYVFLADVSSSKRNMNGASDSAWEKSFRRSWWFTRGWTLQELLAPRIVEFFSRERVLLGRKDTLVQQIHEITGIPTTALHGKSVLDFSIEQRFAWAEKRQTTKAEDKAYCLFGIFNVYLPLIYGEGSEKAIARLKKEIGVTPAQIDEVIQKRYDDGRLNVERLSGKSLPLEYCFINLSIIDHVRDSDTRSASNKSDRDVAAERLSRFSLAARLKVETPPQLRQLSLSTLFEPRKQKDGTQWRPNRVLIWGRAGMGKTTLCKKIVYEIYKNGLWKDLYDRVIWLPLRRLKRIESRNTVELLQNEFPCTGLGERVPEALNKLVQDERTLYLLDGLDEVSFALDQDSPGGRVLQDLVSRSHVIITSRPHNTRVIDHKPPDLELETVGFFPQQVEEYLQVAAKPNIEEIRSFIQERPLVQSLAAIPIQLDAICNTWNMKSFPRDNATMTTLYWMISQSLWKNSILRLGKTGDNGQLVTRQLLEHWSWRYLKNFVEAEILFLQELGFRGLCEEVIEFSVDDIEILETSRQTSSDKIVHLSFLRVSDSSVEADERTFHFIHLTFQEFFAAQYFVRYWMCNEALPLWEQTLYDRLSDQSTGSVTPEEFVKSRKYVDRYDIFWRFVVGLLLTERNKEHLCRFLRILEVEPIDLIGLTHQRLIVHCLSELGEGDNELRCGVRSLEDSYLRLAFCESRLNRSWGRFQSTSLIWEAECSDYIIERLLNKEETEKEVLGALCSRSSISSEISDTVIQRLSESTSKDVRKITIQIIGQHCGHNQREKVLKLFNDVQYLRTTPGEITYAWKETSRLLGPAIKTIVGLLQHPDRNVRSRAVSALGGQTTLPSTAVEALVRLLQDPGRNVRSEAVSALAGQTTLPSTAVEALVQLLQDPDRNVRSRAVSALGGQTTLPSTAVEALVRLLQDLDRYVRSGAARALAGQTTLPSTAVEALVRLLQYPDWPVRDEAASALRRQTILPSTAVEALVQLLQNQDESAHEKVMDLIFSRREVQSLVPTFSSSTLQHFIKHCFSMDSVICFVEGDCFCIRASGHFQRIPLQQHQLELFRAEWRKARDSLGLPSLMPVFSTSVVSNTTSSIHLDVR